jgi:hypothetical protein
VRRLIAAVLCLATLVWAVDAGARFPRGQDPNLFNGGANFVFDKALTAGQIFSLHNLIKTTIYGL